MMARGPVIKEAFHNFKIHHKWIMMTRGPTDSYVAENQDLSMKNQILELKLKIAEESRSKTENKDVAVLRYGALETIVSRSADRRRNA